MTELDERQNRVVLNNEQIQFPVDPCGKDAVYCGSELDKCRQCNKREFLYWAGLNHKPEPCLFDNINPDSPVTGIACSCPKCSPR